MRRKKPLVIDCGTKIVKRPSLEEENEWRAKYGLKPIKSREDKSGEKPLFYSDETTSSKKSHISPVSNQKEEYYKLYVW